MLPRFQFFLNLNYFKNLYTFFITFQSILIPLVLIVLQKILFLTLLVLRQQSCDRKLCGIISLSLDGSAVIKTKNILTNIGDMLKFRIKKFT